MGTAHLVFKAPTPCFVDSYSQGIPNVIYSPDTPPPRQFVHNNFHSFLRLSHRGGYPSAVCRSQHLWCNFGKGEAHIHLFDELAKNLSVAHQQPSTGLIVFQGGGNGLTETLMDLICLSSSVSKISLPCIGSPCTMRGSWLGVLAVAL